jgi:hypothetical protein
MAECGHSNRKTNLVVEDLSGSFSPQLSPQAPQKNPDSVAALYDVLYCDAASSCKADVVVPMRLPCQPEHQWIYDTCVQEWLCRQHYTEDLADQWAGSTRPPIVQLVCSLPCL